MFSSRFVWNVVNSGCSVEEMLHKEKVLGGELWTCKLSTLVSCLCSNRYPHAGIPAFSSVLALEGQRAPFISLCGCGGAAHQ